MIFYREKLKLIKFSTCFFVTALLAQNLEDLSFGDNNSLDVATWNIEWFPKNNQITIDFVTQIINLLDLDVLAIQEVDDTTMFDQMLDSLPDYLGYYQSSWFAGLAYIYNTETVEINNIYEIYFTSEYWNAFPRSPMVMDFNFKGDNFFIINNHFKCCGDGILDYDDPYDEENRRYTATNLLKDYIDNNLSNNNVIVMGDLNDEIAETPPNNVFQQVLDDSINYYFTDMEIAQGNSSNWSFPNWPSHLDHILITDELFNELVQTEVQTIKIDEYVEGGWSEYDYNISDHRPVAIKFSFFSIYDINDDGILNEYDFAMLLSSIINNNDSTDLEDINNDLVVDIFDLLILSDFLQDM
ncbi:MAG: hypothetical protein CMG60_06110 [Candidatus Marinimicrobia bacterium]|nr:hypothetical protein [Candidatus Neomarinimicrobiota bacterium]|tara:strand:+ start:4981 stop:6045 length:1065 start_codon:yes stop_codon:yes gene_type:complete